MADAPNGNGLWTRAMVVGGGILTILGIPFLLQIPQDQRIAHVSDYAKENRLLMKEHAALESHAGTGSTIASMREKFAEVETQFRASRERLDSELNTMRIRLLQCENLLLDRTDRINNLENRATRLETLASMPANK